MAWLSDRVYAIRSSTNYAVFIVAFSLFIDMFLYGVIVPIMPSAIVTRGHARPEDREYWISLLLSSESATALIVCPIAGFITDNSTRRQMPFLGGLVLLIASMLTIALAQDVHTFIVGRCLQGASTAVVAVSGMALAIDVIPRDSVAVTLGWLSAASTMGFTVGPVLGGLLYGLASWWGVFAFIFALLGIDLLLRLAVVESPRLPSQQEDFPESALSGRPIRKASIWDSMAFVKLLLYPRMVWMLFGVIAAGIVISSFDVTLPIFVQDHYRWGPVGQGLVFLPTALPAVLDPFYGYLVSWFGVRVVAFASFVVLVPSLLCLRFVTEDNTASIVLLITLLSIIGLSIDAGDVTFQIETDNVVRAITEKDPDAFGEKGAIGQSFSLQIMAHYVGILIGPSLGGLTEYWGGWKLMSASLAILAGVSALAMTLVGDGWRTRNAIDTETECEPTIGETEPLLGTRD